MGIAREIATTLNRLGQGLMDWLRPLVLDIGGLGDFFFFRAILDFLRERINDFGFDLMERVMSFVGLVALAVLTLYIFIQGYRVVTGQLRESMMGLVANMAKAAFIVAFAVAFGTLGSQVHEYLTVDMKDGIHALVTGSDSTPEEKIDESLGWLQVAMSTMDALDLQGDPALVSEKERAEFYIGLGTGGPAVVAGSMLLLYQIALALFIGLGPLFILCLLFDSTKSLFQRWLFYGIGTMFSMAVLSFMVSLALDMVTRVAVAMWTSAAAGQLLLGQNVVGGMNSMAMQQGGMGLILTTLILTAPPMAAMFFNGTLGGFTAYAMMGSQLGGGPPPMGAPMPGGGQYGGGYGGYRPMPPGTQSTRVLDDGSRQAGDFPTTPTGTYQTGSLQGQPLADTGIRQGSQMPGRETGTPTYTVGQAGTVAGAQQTYAPSDPGTRGAANNPQQVAPNYTVQSASQPPVAAPPPASVPQDAPPPTRVATPTTYLQSTQTPGPTYNPAPPPKDTTPKGGGTSR